MRLRIVHICRVLQHSRALSGHICVCCWLTVLERCRSCWICPRVCVELSVVRFHLFVVEPPTLNITCFSDNDLFKLVRDDARFICQSSELASCGPALWQVLLTADETSRTFSGRSRLSSSCLSRNKSGSCVATASCLPR